MLADELLAGVQAALPAMDTAAATQMWSAALGGHPLLLVRSVAQARRLILRALPGKDGTQFALPANATPALVQQLKWAKRSFVFAELDEQLALEAPAGCLAWAQPAGNLPALPVLSSAALRVVDYGESAPPPAGDPPGDIAIYGLFAATDARAAGALLVFADQAFARRARQHMTEEDQPDARCLAAWLSHWQAIAARQQAALEQVCRGLRAASGLPVAPVTPAGALHDSVLLRIPDEAPAAAFYAYAAAENTPVQWLPLVRPLHYAALREGCGAATHRHLERWLAIPVAPGYDPTHIAHAVLGIVKSAEYLGLRWRTEPAQAAAYAALMNEMYGPGHDAYRPNFAVTTADAQDVATLSALAQAVTCNLSPNGGTHANR